MITGAALSALSCAPRCCRRSPPLADLSSGFSETWAFLDRRIADVMEAGKAWGEVSQAAKTFLAGRVRGFD